MNAEIYRFEGSSRPREFLQGMDDLKDTINEKTMTRFFPHRDEAEITLPWRSDENRGRRFLFQRVVHGREREYCGIPILRNLHSIVASDFFLLSHSFPASFFVEK